MSNIILISIYKRLSSYWLNIFDVQFSFQVFLTYLFFGGSLFILYVEIYEIILRRRHQILSRKSNVRTEGNDNEGSDVTDISEIITEGLSNVTELNIEMADESNNFPHLDVSSVNELPSLRAMSETSRDVGNAFHQTRSQSFDGVDSELPEDVYDYITMHHGTATIASFDTNYFVKCGMMRKFKVALANNNSAIPEGIARKYLLHNMENQTIVVVTLC